MPILRRATLAVLLACAPLLLAQPLDFGEPFPLANIRYEAAGADIGPLVVESNGSDFFAFWLTTTNLRVTKLVEGEQRGGRHVLPRTGTDRFAVTWTGTHFFVAYQDQQRIVGRLLDANGDPAGEPFTVLQTKAKNLAVASNGRTILLLHHDQDLHAVALTTAGVPTAVASRLVSLGGAAFAVASNGTGYALVTDTSAGVVVITLDGDGRERSRELAAVGSRKATHVAIGTDGSDYLAAWQISRAAAEAARVRADGFVTPSVTLEPASVALLQPEPMQVGWTGANWAVAYTTEEGTLRVAYVHPTAPRVTSYGNAGEGTGASMASANREVLLTWRPGDLPSFVASGLPLSSHQPEPVTFAAPRQSLLAVASALHATLAVWAEGDSVGGGRVMRVGVRSADGDWVEHELAPLRAFTGLAASDGQDFVVVTRGTSSDVARFVNTNARVSGGPVTLPLFASWIAWNGSEYLLGDQRSIVRLSRSGTLSPRVEMAPYAILGLASNGRETMAVLIEPEPCPFTCPTLVGRPLFAKLGPDLRPIGQPRPMLPGTSTAISDARVIWDGGRFLAAWSSATRGCVHVSELPVSGGETAVIATFDSEVRSPIGLVPIEDGAALGWRELDGESERTRVVVIRPDDTLIEHAADDALHVVTALPNGRIGLFGSVTSYAAPGQGSPRLSMRVASPGLPPKPAPPLLSGIVDDGHVELKWAAPPERVAGYRLEYRVGSDGTWNEFDRWFDANDAAATITFPLKPHVPYLFRIRAINDAGASEYSETVLVNVPRRRAIR